MVRKLVALKGVKMFFVEKHVFKKHRQCKKTEWSNFKVANKSVHVFLLTALVLFHLLLFSSCAPEIVAPPCDKGICVVSFDDHDKVVAVATSKTDWLYFSLDKNKEVSIGDPKTSLDWDLGFQRYRIKSNGGISGKGTTKVAIIDGKSFEDVTQAPKSGYLQDKEDENGDDDLDFVFLQEGSWFNYDFGKHLLLPKERIYVLHAMNGKYYKVETYSYYSAEGKSGTMTIKLAEVKAP